MFKTIKIFLVLTFLFGIGVFKLISHLQENGYGLLYLVTNGIRKDLVQKREGQIIKGDKILGKFFSPYSNLGTVSVRFTNNNQTSEDVLIFKLKEENSSEWLYQATYKTDQFQAGKLFPFGFPIIKNSDQKNYIFELESVNGIAGKGIYLDLKEPVFSAVSFFSKQQLVQSKKEQITFVVNKIINIFNSKEEAYQVIMYFIPLLLFIVFILTRNMNYQTISLVVGLCILFDTLFLSESYDYLLIWVGVFWFITIFKYNLSPQISNLFAIIFIFITPLLFIAGLSSISEKVANWAFLLLVIVVVQLLQISNKTPKNQIIISKFFYSFIDPKNTSLVVIQLSKLVLIFISLYSLYLTFKTIEHGIWLFKDFYPNDLSSSQLGSYLLLMFTIFILVGLKINKNKVYLVNHKVVFLAVLIALYQVTKILTINFVKFEHDPKIFTVTPSNTNEAWTDVTISGRNFKNLPFVGKIYLSGVEQGEYLISWSDKKVVFRTSPTLSSTGQLCLTTLYFEKSNCVPFVYEFNKNNRLK